MKYFSFFFFLMIFFFLTSYEVQAQNTVKGIICDSLTKEKLMYATVKLKNVTDSLISGAISDEKGSFVITGIPQGNYILTINYLSYKSISLSLNINSLNKTVNLKEIYLFNEGVVLNEINVKPNNITESIDKLEYRLDSLTLNTAIDAFQAMKKIPGLVINQNAGTITTIDNENVLLLVNYMFCPTESLRTIKPDEIERIEVLKNSLVEYGVSTVVNIILKKEVKQGFKSIIGCQVESQIKNITTKIKIEYGYEKLKLFANYQFHNYGYKGFTSTYRKNKDGEELFEYKSVENDFKDKFNINHYFKFGLEYYFNSTTQISISSNQSYSNDNMYKLLTSNKFFNGELYETQKLYYHTKETKYNPNLALFFRKEFKPNQELIMTGNYYIFNNALNTTINDSIYSVLNVFTENRMELTNLQQTYYIAKVTYKQNFGKMKFKTGYDLYYLKLDKEYNSNQEQNYNYQQLVNSVFSTLIGTIKGIEFMAGIRLRNYYHSTTGYSKTYFDYLPTITFSKKINKIHTFDLSAYRKLYYPSNYQISNSQVYKDSMNVEDVNPYLKPAKEITSKFNYTFQKGKFYWKSGINYSLLTDCQETVETIDENNIKHSKYENTGKNITYGINSTISFTLFEKLTLNPGIDLKYIERISENIPKILNWYYWFSFSPEFAVSENFYFGCEFYYGSRAFYRQGYYDARPWFFINAGMSILKDKGQLKLSVNTIQNKFKYVQETSEFYSENNYYTNNQCIFLEFSYTILKGKEIKNMAKDAQSEQDL